MRTRHIAVGDLVFTDAPLELDIDKLVAGRLLVQANSGAGKSRTLRRLMEQTHGHIQHIIIDPEGEFSTLRERFDYVLAARTGGDTVADPRSAALLAEKLLELKVSAVCDLYEHKRDDRILFVARFLDALVNADKRLWHPVLIWIDEASLFCPEKGSTSGKDEPASAQSVIDLCTRGRKRGFCAVLAVQRLSTLNKNAAAECNNKLIGRSSLDVDMARAAKEIGFSTRETVNSLRTLDAGNFYAFGPAFSERTVSLVHVGDVATSHPQIGSQRAASVTKPTAAIKALLPQLADLPAEADERLRTVEDLRQQLADQKRALAKLQKAQPPAPRAEVRIIERFVLKDGQLERAEKLVDRAIAGIMAHHDRLQATLDKLGAWNDQPLTALRAIVDSIAEAIEKTKIDTPTPIAATGDHRPDQPAHQSVHNRRLPTTQHRPDQADAPHGRSGSPAAPATPPGDIGSLSPMARAFLTALAQYPDGLPKKKILAYTGYRASGDVSTLVAKLVAEGVAAAPTKGLLQITAHGRHVLGPFDPLPVGEALRDRVLAGDRLSKMERAFVAVLFQVYPKDIAKGEILERTGYRASGDVSTAFAKLVAIDYAVQAGAGRLRAADMFFEEER